MKAFGSFFTLSSLLAVVVHASNVVDLTPDNFDDVVLKSGKPALVEFFAVIRWIDCKNLAPVYEQLADSFASQKDKVTIAKVDADDHKSLGKRFGVSGFPTLKWFDGEADTPIAYDSKRDLESLQTFVTEKSGIRVKAKKELPSNVVVLTDANFDDVALDTEKNVLVEFYAPWCGHCKALAPTYEIIATTYHDEPDIVIAKIDADSPNAKATAEKYGIAGFPTLKWFPKGSTEPIPYDTGRTEAALVEFINTHAGTNRAVGGGLNDKAGRIEKLDEIVKKLVKGDTTALEAAITEAKEVVADLSSKYAPYYVKVLEKIAKTQGHVEKELKRLDGIISKGGLASTKLDDLSARKNILKQFYAEEAPAAAKDEL
ncbi:hypothetical protein RUND412_010903 [Rhizina undulata]